MTTMKNSQKGFIVLVLLVIIALLVIAGGIYYYNQSGYRIFNTTRMSKDKDDVSLPQELNSQKTSEVKTTPQKPSNTSDQTTISTKTKTSQCVDSDDGLNYYVKGTSNYTHGPLGIKSDTCFARNPGSTEARQVPQCSPGQSCFVYELFCSATDDLKFEEHSCPDGCSNGACIK